MPDGLVFVLSGVFESTSGDVEMKFRNMARRYGAVVGLVSVAAVPALSLAVGPAAPDLSSLTPDFTTVTTGILAVAAAIAGVYVAWKGAKILIRAIKGA